MTLAALAQDDRNGAAVEPSLARPLARRLRDRLEALTAQDPDERRTEVHRLAATLRRLPSEPDLPPRVLGLLASDAPRRTGRRWLELAPRPRRGFFASASLKASLRRLAAPDDPHAGTKEQVAAPKDLALGTAPNAARLHAWATRLSRHEDRQRVLGALVLGASPPGADDREEVRESGDARSRTWRRIGRELALAWEAPWRT